MSIRALAFLSAALYACGVSPSPLPPEAPQQWAASESPSTTAKAPGSAVVGDKTVCPISNEEFTVTSASPKVEYLGKTYYFCCPGCDTKFKEDPEKYLRRKGA